MVFALLLLRQLSPTETPATVSNGATQFDAGAPPRQGGTDAPALEPVRRQ
jgi:hypothetical protein